MDLNTVAISGRLTADVDLLMTRSGSDYINFSVAVNGRKKQGDEWVDDPKFFDVSMFGSYAAAVAPYLTKGTKVAVQGRLDQSKWETDDGQKRSKVSIIADRLDINSQAERTGERPVQQSMGIYEDDDVPF